MKPTKSKQIIFNDKKPICKVYNFSTLLTFFVLVISTLVVSI